MKMLFVAERRRDGEWEIENARIMMMNGKKKKERNMRVCAHTHKGNENFQA